MAGAFGGSVEAGESAARESVPDALASLLAPDGDPAAPLAGLVPIRGAVSTLVYAGDLRGLAPLERGDAVPTLRAIAAAAKALQALHAAGRVHGDLRPAHVWTGHRTLLSYVEKPLDASALLRARLRHGAEPRDVDFAAPEVTAGEPATPASDTFSLGAIVFWALTGRTPHGRLELPPGAALTTRLGGLVLLALDAVPGRRADLRELVDELGRAAPAPAPAGVVRVRRVAAPSAASDRPLEVPAGGPPPAEAVLAGSAPVPVAIPVPEETAGNGNRNGDGNGGQPQASLAPAALAPKPGAEPEVIAELQAAATERRDTRIIHTLVLALGSIFVLTGALWLVAVGWDPLGEWGRFGVLCGLAAAIGGAGRFLETRGHARSGLALVVLASQLLWAIGADLLAITGAEHEPASWALVAGAVAASGYLLAWTRKSPAVAVLSSLGALMAIVFTWQALDARGHCVLLSLATAGLAGSAFALERRGHAGAPAVHFLWTQLLWLDGGFFLDVLGRSEQPGPWAVVSGAVAMTTFWIAARRSSVAFSIVGTLAAALALVQTGAALSTGGKEGPAEWTLVCAAILGAMGIALAARVAPRAGAPPAFAGACFLVVSAFLAMTPADIPVAFSIAWPYGAALAAALAAVALDRARRRGGAATSGLELFAAGAFVVATLVLVGAPTFHAAAERDLPVMYQHGGAAAGLLLLALGVFLGARPGFAAAAFLVGIAHAALERTSGLTASAFALALLVAAWQSKKEAVALVAAIAVALALALWADSVPRDRTVFWAEWALLAALLEAALALVATSRGGGDAFSVLAALIALASAAAALGSFDQALVFSVAWPYLVAGLAALAALASERLRAPRARRGAALVAAVVLVATPLWHGLRDGPVLEPYRIGAPIAGAIVLLGSFAWPAARSRRAVTLAAALVGVAHVAASRSPAGAAGAVSFALVAHGALLRDPRLGTAGSLVAVLSIFLARGELHIGVHPLEDAEWAGAGAALLAGVALSGHLAGADEVGHPAAITAALLVVASWLLSIGAGSDVSAPLLALAWPYLLTVPAIAIAAAARPLTYRGIALAPAALVLAVTPTLEALEHGDARAYLYVATVAGTLVLVSAFNWPLLSGNRGVQILAILVGLSSVATAPIILALAKLATRDADQLFREVLDPGLDMAQRVEHPLFFLSYVVLTASVLVALGLLFARDAERKTPYRIIEAAGLATFLGTITLLSLLRYQDYLYAAVLLGGGLTAIGAGALSRHVLLVVVPAFALVLQVWFQYFAKLTGKAHMGLLLVGFGIGLLATAALFEKRVRPRLGELTTWA
jgi:hypothetical protein